MMDIKNRGVDPTALIYEDDPRYDRWLRPFLWGLVVVAFMFGVFLMGEDETGAMIMFGVSLFYTLLFRSIVPRKLQIFQDRLRIVLGSPFAWNIPLSGIREGRVVSGSKAFFFGGVRLATSSSFVVEIDRERGLNVVISPASGEEFVGQLNRAIAAGESGRG